MFKSWIFVVFNSDIPGWHAVSPVLKWKHLLCFCFQIPWNVTTPLQSPSATFSRSYRPPIGGRRVTWPESEQIRRQWGNGNCWAETNKQSHLSSVELRDNTRNTKLGIIIISSTREKCRMACWLIGNILLLALTWLGLPGNPTVWRTELLEYWSKGVTFIYLTDPYSYR